MKEIVSQLLGISQASYYRWKKERMGISLIEKYFTKEELQEYLNTGRVASQERRTSDADGMDEFFLKSALGKIELYGTERDTPIYISNNISMGEQIEALLPIEAFMTTFSDQVANDAESFHSLLYGKKRITRKEKLIIKDFTSNKLSRIEFSSLFKHKRHVTEYINSLANLNGG